MDGAQQRELLSRVQELLGRYGVAGKVSIATGQIRLVGSGPTVTADLEDVESMAALDPGYLRTAAERLARLLAAERRRLTANTQESRAWWWSWLRLLGGLGALAYAGWLAWQWLGRPVADATEVETPVTIARSAAPASVPLSPQALCRRTAARLATGGTVTRLDVDGWVIEILLLWNDRAPTPKDPVFLPFFPATDQTHTRRLAWKEDPALSATKGPNTGVILEQASAFVGPQPPLHGLRVLLSGGYVAPYFDQNDRARIVRLAAALYEATGADFGALYAHCEHEDARFAGSWFRGANLTEAVRCLRETMSQGPVRPIASPHPASIASGSNQSVLGPRQRRELAILLGHYGGMIAERPGSWSTITFPFADASRASRAAMALKRLR